MELGAGNYKQSEYGPIPNDWIITEFQDVIDGFSSGQTPSRAKPEFYNGDIPWITSGELNYNVITDTKEKITKEGVQDALLKTIPVGTFLFAITGLEAAGTRGSCALTGIEATTNQSCMALYPKNGILTTPYLYHFYVGFGNEIALKYCQGTKQQSFTAGIVKKLPIIVPPTIEEQKAIAQVLSDFDNLIDGLERLIAKKRSIKEGVMQELLRPKEGWEIKKLGEVAEMYSGGTPLTSVPSYYYGDIPWVVIADITKSGKYISKTEKTISQAGLANSSAKLFKNGVLLFAMYASIGKSTIALMETTCNQAILGIEPKLIDREYLYYVLSFNEKKFIAFGQTGTQSNLSKEMVQKLEIPIPKSVEEQIQIATILSQIDLEIATLVSKLEKYNQLRLGVARQLLTGKTRLV